LRAYTQCLAKPLSQDPRARFRNADEGVVDASHHRLSFSVRVPARSRVPPCSIESANALTRSAAEVVRAAAAASGRRAHRRAGLERRRQSHRVRAGTGTQVYCAEGERVAPHACAERKGVAPHTWAERKGVGACDMWSPRQASHIALVTQACLPGCTATRRAGAPPSAPRTRATAAAMIQLSPLLGSPRLALRGDRVTPIVDPLRVLTHTRPWPRDSWWARAGLGVASRRPGRPRGLASLYGLQPPLPDASAGCNYADVVVHCGWHLAPDPSHSAPAGRGPAYLAASWPRRPYGDRNGTCRERVGHGRPLAGGKSDLSGHSTTRQRLLRHQ
jgi:hypothetical protein